MFNPFRSKNDEASLQQLRQKQMKSLQKTQEGSQQQKIEQLQQFMEAFMKMKTVENKFYLHCSQKCLGFHEASQLTGNEKQCLKTCNDKMRKFIEISNNNFKHIEGGMEEVSETYNNLSSTMQQMQKMAARN